MIKEIEFKRPTSSSDETRLTRYGLPWTTNELLDLEFYWREGDYVEDISKKMQRPIAGIMAKLVATGYIDRRDFKEFMFVDLVRNKRVTKPQPQTQTLTQPTQETTIMANIETKTFIDNQDASRLSDDEIFSKIAALEAQINNLSAISNRPKKLDAKIAQLKRDIQSLVDYVDNRE